LGDKPLQDISTEDVQRLKGRLAGKAPKTVNNVMAILGVALTTAESWSIIERRSCTIKPVKVPKSDAKFYDFDAFERVVTAARADSEQALLVVLLGGEAGLRCGEIMALEWRDIDLPKRQLTVRQSEWKGHVSTPRGIGCVTFRSRPG
jgi:integrase